MINLINPANIFSPFVVEYDTPTGLAGRFMTGDASACRFTIAGSHEESAVQIRFAETIICRFRQNGLTIIRGRCEHESGEPVASGDITGIEATVALGTIDDYGDPTFVAVDNYDPATLVVGDVWYDTLQEWDEDDVGYNFRWCLPSAAIQPDAEQLAAVEVAISLSGYDDPVLQRWQGPIVRGLT